MNRSSQKGMALLVSTILLFGAITVGVSSMRSVVSEETITANVRAISLAKQSAETAASQAISRIYDDEIEVSQGDFPDPSDGSELVEWGDFSSGAETAACSFSECFYRYVRLTDDNVFGQPAGFYVVSSAVVVDSDSAVVAESGPVFVGLNPHAPGVPLGFLRSAINVFGGIESVNSSNWFPNSKKAEISGGTVTVYDDEGNPEDIAISSLYHEGEEFNESNINEKKTPFPDGIDYGGDSEETMENSAAWLEFIYNVTSSQEEVVKELDSSHFVSKGDECNASNSYFAVVETFDVSGETFDVSGETFDVSGIGAGQSKFCGVLIVLTDEDIVFNGNQAVEGFAIVANPEKNGDEFDFSEPLNDVSFSISGGGGEGSAFFNINAIQYAFQNSLSEYLAENNLSFMDFIFNPVSSDQVIVGGGDQEIVRSWM